MIYSDAVMEHFLHPRHVGVMNSSDADVGTGEAGSHDTGALIRIQLEVFRTGPDSGQLLQGLWLWLYDCCGFFCGTVVARSQPGASRPVFVHGRAAGTVTAAG